MLYDEWAQRKVYLLVPHLSQPQFFNVTMQAVTNVTVQMAIRCYVNIGAMNGHVLRIKDAPPTHRALWPVLAVEYNSHELAKLPPWQQALYRRDDAASKWIIKPEHETWTRGEAE